MKFLATIREFTSLLFNRPDGTDIEVKPASRSADGAGEKVIDIPDGNDNADTLVLEAEDQTLTNKSIDADQNTITNIDNADVKLNANIDAAKLGTGVVDNTEFNKLNTAGTDAADELVKTDSTQNLSNKTLTSPDIAGGTVTADVQLDGGNITMAATETVDGRDVSVDGAALDLHLTDDALSKHDADQIDYDNTTSGLTATNTQTAIDEVEGRVDTAETNISENASDIADIRTTTGTADGETDMGTFTGSTIQDNVSTKTALQDLETSHEAHTGASSGVHGVTGDVVGTTDTQTLSAKTISTLKHDSTTIAGSLNITMPDETVVYLNSGSSISGITGGSAGDVRIFINISGSSITILDVSADDFFNTYNIDLGGSAFSVDLEDDQGITLVYDGSVWRPLAGLGDVTLDGNQTLSNKILDDLRFGVTAKTSVDVNNNLDLTSSSPLILVGGSITQIDTMSTDLIRHIHLLYNSTGSDLTLLHDHDTDGFFFASGEDYTLAPNSVLAVFYDSGSRRWLPLAPDGDVKASSLKGSVVETAADSTIDSNLGSVIEFTSVTNPVDTLSNGADGDIRFLYNASGSDVTLTHDSGAGGLLFSNGSDLTLVDGASVGFVYSATDDRWSAFGGGAGGGLTTANLSGAATVANSTHYLVDTSGGAFTATLPAGSPGAVIRFSDVTDNWATANLTIAAAGAETIDGDATLIADVAGTWVQLMWDSVAGEWKTDDPIVQSQLDFTGNLDVDGNITATGSITAGTTLSDGTASLTSGSLTGAVNVTASGTVQSDIVRADTITNEAGGGAPSFSQGLTSGALTVTSAGAISGATTIAATSNISSGGVLSGNTLTGRKTVTNGSAIAPAIARAGYFVIVSSNFGGGPTDVRSGIYHLVVDNAASNLAFSATINTLNSQTATFSVSGGNVIINGLPAGNNQVTVITN